MLSLLFFFLLYSFYEWVVYITNPNHNENFLKFGLFETQLIGYIKKVFLLHVCNILPRYTFTRKREHKINFFTWFYMGKILFLLLLVFLDSKRKKMHREFH